MLRHLDLFTGSGIGIYAAQHCGIHTIACCENDPACLYCLERMFPHAKQFKDVKHVTDDALRSLGPIDIISGGFPCTDISTAGKGAGIEGKASGLWFEMLRIIDAARPTWILAENVPALRVRGADVVLAGLEELGYTCWPIVVGAWAVGAPHKRDRVWIVGHADERQCEWDAGNQIQTGRDTDNGAGVTVADAESISEREPDNETSTITREVSRESIGGGSRWPSRPGEPAGGNQLADAAAGRFGADRSPFGETGHADFRWPGRPGEPQHDWEAPRLTQCGLGSPAYELAERVCTKINGTDNGISPKKIAGQANKAMLRMLGNGWVYPLALMLFQWIAAQDAENRRKLRKGR